MTKKEIIMCCFGNVNAKTAALFANTSKRYVYNLWFQAGCFNRILNPYPYWSKKSEL